MVFSMCFESSLLYNILRKISKHSNLPPPPPTLLYFKFFSYCVNSLPFFIVLTMEFSKSYHHNSVLTCQKRYYFYIVWNANFGYIFWPLGTFGLGKTFFLECRYFNRIRSFWRPLNQAIPRWLMFIVHCTRVACVHSLRQKWQNPELYSKTRDISRVFCARKL